MLTQTQRDNFRLALASYNSGGSVKNVDELDMDDMLSDNQIVETRETIDDFFASRGRRMTRFGTLPSKPMEANETLLGMIYVWENQQSRKGARRGTLYVMDMGAARACLFTGEV